MDGSIPRLLDEVWYVDADEEVRVERLIRRHVAHGKTPAAARRWVLGSDARNAAAIAPTRARADLVVALPAHLPPLPPLADPEAARCSG
jgi:pantothenate kinase